VSCHAILPAAGLATRMRGLPKFALPCSTEYQTLLERHVQTLLEVAETVWIPTRPWAVSLVTNIAAHDRVVVTGVETSTMSETVLRTASLSGADRFILGMPDTYFFGEQPYTRLAQTGAPLALAAWNIRDEQRGKLGQLDLSPEGQLLSVRDKDPLCSFPLAWGAMAFERDFLRLLDVSMPHVGYGIPPAIASDMAVEVLAISGDYYDCGTPSEYFDLVFRLASGEPIHRGAQ
jgi:hypothetical protein